MGNSCIVDSSTRLDSESNTRPVNNRQIYVCWQLARQKRAILPPGSCYISTLYQYTNTPIFQCYTKALMMMSIFLAIKHDVTFYLELPYFVCGNHNCRARLKYVHVAETN